MSPAEPFATDSTPALSPIAPQLDALAARLGVKSVLVMRSAPDAMVVAATAGEATRHYTVGAAGKKAGDDASRTPLYCERVVGTVCVLDDQAREYSDAERAELNKVRAEVEKIVATNTDALG